MSVLYKTSVFFKAVTKPKWDGTGPRTIDLSTGNVDVFHVYLQWLYSGKVAVCYFNERQDSPDICMLGDSYLLGERLMDTEFCNAMLQVFMGVLHLNIVYMDHLIRGVYRETTSSSLTRKLLVHAWVWEMDSKSLLEDIISRTNPEFVEDLVKAPARWCLSSP